jgi:hypothetical protein
MPGTSPSGYPYAEPTDPLVQWPATSQQLAARLEERAVVLAGTGAYPIDDGGNGTIPIGSEGLEAARSTTVVAAVNRVSQDWATANGYGPLLVFAQVSPAQTEIGFRVLAASGPPAVSITVTIDWIAVRA